MTLDEAGVVLVRKRKSGSRRRKRA